MIRRMLGAPLGGTTRGGHHGVESLALSLITPPNGIGGGGICLPSIVTVESGEPATPLICWALVVTAASRHSTRAVLSRSTASTRQSSGLMRRRRRFIDPP